jgi:hypothetical protein
MRGTQAHDRLQSSSRSGVGPRRPQFSNTALRRVTHLIDQNAFMPQLPWPERFSIAILPVKATGPAARYEVVTWLHAEKAIAIAVETYLRQNASARIYDVTVEHIGPARRREDGMVDVCEGDLADRYEW